MAKKGRKVRATKEEVELLRDLLITQLGIAGVRQDVIREIAVCGANRVSAIVKHIKTKKGTS